TQVEIVEENFEKVEIISFFKEFKNVFSSYKYSLDIKTSEDNIYLSVNKDKFNQVLFNLIDNAKTFSPANSTILIMIKIKNEICSIDIVDQGSGINFDYNEKIFDRFYTDREIDRNSHSGLGLSISRKIIESFGGNLKLVKNTHSGFDGACFNIELPLKDLKN
ncbi:ATP-binding protein, partial [Alphaproteobacteria bacterium]|nr:ATP-binding protein [Alphaproteobacteria bacterium]